MRSLRATLLPMALLALACAQEPIDAPPRAPELATSSKFLRAAEPIPGQYIVVLAEPQVGAAQEDVPALANALAARHGGTLLHVYQHSIRGFAVRMPEAQARALAEDPAIAYVEEDGVVHAAPLGTSSELDSASSGQVGTSAVQTGAPWGLDRIDQRALPLDGNYTYYATAATVNAYVLDTGIRMTHTEFNGRAVPAFDIFGGNGQDCNGHGTHTAGVTGGNIYGVAKRIKLHSVRVLDCNGAGAWSGVIQGVDYVSSVAVKPAIGVMMLYGGANAAVDDAVRISISRGITYVVAAGISNIDACTQSPARVAEAITVASTTSSDGSASFNNYGSCIDILAPGVNITGPWATSDTALTTISGSKSTPHVAGAAALYLEVDPGASPATVAAALINNSTKNVLNPAPPPPTPNRLLYTGFIGSKLTNAAAITGLAHPSQEVRYFSIDVPSGVSTLKISTSGGSGDVDLYVRHGAFPDLNNWSCRPYYWGNDETCIFNAPAPGRYYIMLHAYNTYSGVTLLGSY